MTVFETSSKFFAVSRIIIGSVSSRFSLLAVTLHGVIANEQLNISSSVHHYHWRSVCVNGAIYWTYSRDFLMIFDVGTEQLRLMPVPDAGSDYFLMELDCCLCLFRYKAVVVWSCGF